VTATSLTSGESVAFVESSRQFMPWERVSRRGVAATLAVEHLMASVAIPLLFPAVEMAGLYYNDGAVRQSTPLAPAIHLGADRILVIGVRPPGQCTRRGRESPQHGGAIRLPARLALHGRPAGRPRAPQPGQRAAAALPLGAAPLGMRHVETMLVLPEIDPAESAIAHRDSMPGSLRALLRILGARGARGGKLLSYLLFEAPYTRELIAAGVRGRELPARTEIAWFPGARLDEEDRAEAEHGREPHHVGDGRQDHSAGERRVDATPLQVIGISPPAIAAATRLITIAMKMTAATFRCRTRARS
jgi:NTE family protein